MDTAPLNVAVVLGTVRDGRFGPAVAEWLTGQAGVRSDLDTDLIDLARHPLPTDLSGHAGTADPETGRVRDRLSARLAAADAFVVVTPEYNHSVPAGLKNALDWFLDEWAAKPVGFVSYGGMGGGLRAVEHLRQIFAELHAVTVRETVSFHNVWQDTDGQGGVRGSEASRSAAKAMLDQLAWWGRALRRARDESPYRR